MLIDKKHLDMASALPASEIEPPEVDWRRRRAPCTLVRDSLARARRTPSTDCGDDADFDRIKQAEEGVQQSRLPPRLCAGERQDRARGHGKGSATVRLAAFWRGC